MSDQQLTAGPAVEPAEAAPAADADSGAPETDPAPGPGLARRTVDRIGTGARYTWSGLRHTVATGHQADEEIRRRIVLRQLSAYEALRETASEELRDVRTRIVRLEQHGAAEGWTPEQRQEVRALRDERKRREAAGKDLSSEPFRAVQPSQQQIRRARYASGTRRVVALVVVAGVVVALLVRAPQMLLLALPCAGVALWWTGGRPPVLGQRPVPAALLRSELDSPPLGAELRPDASADQDQGGTDLREVQTPQDATDCIRRALARNGAKVAELRPAVRTPWGWQATMELSSGTGGAIVKLLPDLDTAFRVGQGRTLAATNPQDSGEVVLRVLTSDPFASPPAYPTRAPLSCSIYDAFSPCISLDGAETPMVLAGLHVLIVAVTGGGKSSLMRSLAEWVTACRDAVAWDIDPSGRGLGPLGVAAGRRALTEKDAEAALGELVDYAKRRTALLADTEDNWVITPEAPAIVAFVDEYHLLSKTAKGYALDLVRIGRKARITAVITTPDATSDILGDAVADSFGIRAMMPCRQADVPLVVGKASAVSDGWLPHLLTPGDATDPGDAGQCYVWTARHRDPILRYVVPLDAPTALRRAEWRAGAGLPALDAPTTGQAGQTDVPSILRQLLDAFAAEGDPEHLSVAQLVDHLAQDDPARWKQWDARQDRLAMAGREISAALKAAGLDVPKLRLSTAGRPTAYRLADLKAAL